MEDAPNRVPGVSDPSAPAAGPRPEASGAPGGKRPSGVFTAIALRLKAVTGRLAAATGHLAAAIILLLAATIVMGIALRIIGIDNYWTYDLDLFSLAWLAFVGAVLTSLRGHHVTAGIALENMLGGRGTVLALLRFAIVAAFLVIFAVSGYRQAYTSYLTHETTIDVVAWPVWIAEAALPLGAILWLIAEIYKLLRWLTDPGLPKK